MSSRIRFLALLLTLLALLTACSSLPADPNGVIGGADGPTSILLTRDVPKEDKTMSYVQISQQEAHELMLRSDFDGIILDVRTQAEYDGGHIPGAICVPVESIGGNAPAELPDKTRTILVYCRSGRRSKDAAGKLAALGYSDVREFGGILTWAYETVKSGED